MGVIRPRRDLLVVEHADPTSVWALLVYVLGGTLVFLVEGTAWGKLNLRRFLAVFLGIVVVSLLSWIRACWRIVSFDRDLDRVSIEEHWRWGTTLRVFPSSEIKAVRATKIYAGGRDPYRVQMRVGKWRSIDLDRFSTPDEAEQLVAEIRNFPWRRGPLALQRTHREDHAR